MARRDARPGRASWPRPGRRQGHDLGFGIGIAQGYATLGRIGFEGRFDYAAIGSVTNLAARLCAERRAVADPGHRSASSPPPRTLVVGERRSASCELRGFSRPVRAFDVKGIDDGTGRVMTGDLGPPPPRRRRRCPTSTRTSATARFDRLQARMADVWEAMRLNHDDESVVVVPSITLDRAGAAAARMTQALRGAVPVPAAAAAPAAAADGLRDVDADRARRSSSTTSPCCPA